LFEGSLCFGCAIDRLIVRDVKRYWLKLHTYKYAINHLLNFVCRLLRAVLFGDADSAALISRLPVWLLNIQQQHQQRAAKKGSLETE